jgi:2-dehydropantoate 2-reductase
MKTAILGAGAIGTLLAAYMVKGGADITMIDLPDIANRINRDDVEIKTLSGDSFKVRLKATADAKSLNDIDLLIVCVKTFHSEAAVSSVAHLKNRLQAVLSIQNGVDKELILEKYFGKDKVMGGCCLEAASRLDEKTVMHTMSVVTYLGELDGSISPRVKSAVKLFTGGGLKAEPSDKVVSADWCKWINFAAASAVCALTRLPYYKALLNPHSADLIAQIYREYAKLAKASGVEVFDYPGFEVKTVSRAAKEKAVKLLQQRGNGLKEKGATKVMPSIAQDVVAGRRTECESIFGFAVREGETHHLAMPFSRHVYALLSAIDQSLG